MNPAPSTAGHWPLVRIGGRDVPRVWLETPDEHPDILPLLRHARLQGEHPLCLCTAGAAIPHAGAHHPADQQVALYVCQWGDRLLLKRLPGTGHRHHPKCPSFGGISPTARGLYASEALREVDGRVRLALDVPLITIELARSALHAVEAASDAGVAGRQRSTLSLHGLLSFLWEDAHLNTCDADAGPPRLGEIYTRLRTATMDVDLGPRRPLADQLFIPDAAAFKLKEPVRQSPALFDALARLQARAGANHGAVLLVLGELLSFEPRGRYGSVMATIKGLADTPIWFRGEDADRVRGRAQQAFARQAARAHRDSEATSRLFMLCGVADLKRQQARGAVNLSGLYATVLETDAHGIPVESHHELRMAQHLRQQGRTFSKPMHYDAAVGLLPDFELLDVRPPPSIEVWGMNTDAYLARKREKLALYRAQRRACIEWDAARGDPLPALPAASLAQGRSRNPLGQETHP
jgi:hypothetical protein